MKKFSHNFKFSTKKQKSAFTLAETIIILVILGVISVILIPQLTRKSVELRNKTKIKKAFSDYENLINSFIIKNNIYTNSEIDALANNNNCANTRDYFKIVKNGDTNCRFKTSDGIWWDITTLRSTTIALNEENLTDGTANSMKTNKAFKFISGYYNNILMINSDEYFGSEMNLIATRNLLEYLFGKTIAIQPKIEAALKTTCKNTSGSVFSVNPARKNCTTRSAKYHFIFDENGILIASYRNCNTSSKNDSTCTHFSYFKKDYPASGEWLHNYYELSSGKLTSTQVFENNNASASARNGCKSDGTDCTLCYDEKKFPSLVPKPCP